MGKNRRVEADRCYRETWTLNNVLIGDYVMVPRNFAEMKKKNAREVNIVYDDGKENDGNSTKSFVATIEGVNRRFDTASVVFDNMKRAMQGGKRPLTTDDLLLYKKRVRGDTLSLIINLQLRLLGNQLIKGTSRYIGDCVITCPDSALILACYQNSNKSCNKTEKIRKKALETLKIGDKPVDMGTLFS